MLHTREIYQGRAVSVNSNGLNALNDWNDWNDLNFVIEALTISTPLTYKEAKSLNAKGAPP